MNRVWFILPGILIGVFLSVLFYPCNNTAVTAIHRDTVVLWDTMVQCVPTPIEVKPLGFIPVRVHLLGRVEVSDSASYRQVTGKLATDSVDVLLPIEQKVYQDSTYKAWVSGYNVNLDSIQTYRPTRYITITTKEESRWEHGLQGGIGITPKGIQPYIGYGIVFKF